MVSTRYEQRYVAQKTRVIVLEARQVSKTYSSERQQLHDRAVFPVLDTITVQVVSGEVVALLGPSGAGKSTLLRMLAGLLTPNTGQVLWRGVPLHGPDPHVGLFSPLTALFPWLTMLEQVELALLEFEPDSSQRRARARAALRAMGLGDCAQLVLRDLPEGIRLRVGLARAMAMEPDVLLLDEPFSTCNALTARQLQDELLLHWRERRLATSALVFATHNIADAVCLADRFLVLGAFPDRICIDLPGLPVEKRVPQYEEFRRLVHTLSWLLSYR